MSKDEFTRLYVYMEKRFDAIEAQLEQKADKKFVLPTLDYLIKKQEIQEQEYVAIMQQLERIESKLATIFD